MRYLVVVLALPLLTTPCLAVGGDAMAGGMRFGGSVTVGERVAVGLLIAALVGGLADALLSAGDWAKPLALAAYGGVPFLATVASEQVVGPGGPSFEHLALFDPLRPPPAALAWAAAVTAVGFAPGWVRVTRRQGLRATGKRWAAAAGCGLVAAALANVVVPTEGGDLGLALIVLVVVAVVGIAGLLLAGVRVWRDRRRPLHQPELTG